MIKKYIKKVPITAEQWTGSQEMRDRYKVFYVGKESYLHTLEGNMKLEKGDYIATSIKGEHWAIDKKYLKKLIKK